MLNSSHQDNSNRNNLHLTPLACPHPADLAPVEINPEGRDDQPRAEDLGDPGVCHVQCAAKPSTTPVRWQNTSWHTATRENTCAQCAQRHSNVKITCKCVLLSFSTALCTCFLPIKHKRITKYMFTANIFPQKLVKFRAHSNWAKVIANAKATCILLWCLTSLNVGCIENNITHGVRFRSVGTQRKQINLSYGLSLRVYHAVRTFIGLSWNVTLI